MCLASAYRLRSHLSPHARRLSALTTTLRPPMPAGSCHDASALRFDSHETWQHPSISLGEHSRTMANIRTNRHRMITRSDVSDWGKLQLSQKLSMRSLLCLREATDRCVREFLNAKLQVRN